MEIYLYFVCKWEVLEVQRVGWVVPSGNTPRRFLRELALPLTGKRTEGRYGETNNH